MCVWFCVCRTTPGSLREENEATRKESAPESSSRSPSRRRGDSRTRAHLPGLSGVCLHLLRVEPDTVASLHQVPPTPAERLRVARLLSLFKTSRVRRSHSFVHARRWAPYAGAAVDGYSPVRSAQGRPADPPSARCRLIQLCKPGSAVDLDPSLPLASRSTVFRRIRIQR